jgi:hypothetical protein
VQNLSELTRKLVEAQVEFVLISGFAAVAHGATLVTRDVDICCRFSEGNLSRIQKALNGLHPVHRSRPDLPLELTPEQCTRLKNLCLKTDLGGSELFGRLPEREPAALTSNPIGLPLTGFGLNIRRCCKREVGPGSPSP